MMYPIKPGDHEANKLKAAVKESWQALGAHKIRVQYLHVPDRSVPFENTLEAVNELYQVGHLYVTLIFRDTRYSQVRTSETFGLSNYMSFEVPEIVGICKRRGSVLPTVCEGVYNIIDRGTEAEYVLISAARLAPIGLTLRQALPLSPQVRHQVYRVHGAGVSLSGVTLRNALT